MIPVNPSPNVSEHLRDILGEDRVRQGVGTVVGARSGVGSPAPPAQATHTGEPPVMGTITRNDLILFSSLYILKKYIYGGFVVVFFSFLFPEKFLKGQNVVYAGGGQWYGVGSRQRGAPGRCPGSPRHSVGGHVGREPGLVPVL